eukprot:scaffold233_cov198-Chaetoceros_neogracile.AAC.17
MLVLEDDAIFYKQHKTSSWKAAAARDPYHGQHSGKVPSCSFLDAFSSLWDCLTVVPDDDDFGIVYLGFSARGEKYWVHNNCSNRSSSSSNNNNSNNNNSNNHSHVAKTEESSSIKVNLFRPTYGFHTHAYIISKTAARILLENLPVVGPLDVWLADNQWFGMENIFCAVVANEGWKGEGAALVSQRKYDTRSDIRQSGRV